MSDLFGNHIVGFPTRRLICKYMWLLQTMSIVIVKTISDLNMKHGKQKNKKTDIPFGKLLSAFSQCVSAFFTRCNNSGE